ncbi:MAG: tRNA (adenosine(37)-N6)-threonylcarbamoyltransferase complex dimerization subunit type 1 TsaB, partial [Nitrospira sp.]
METATSWQSVAIVEDEGVVAQEQHDVGVRHGLTLLSTIDRMLKQTGLLLTDLDGLACSIGPGSFTGIRVGLATCLGLRMATGLPLMVIPTLEAMAFMVQKRTSTASLLCPILPGRSGELYWALFKSGEEGQLERVMQERVGPPEAVGASLSTDTMVFGGDGQLWRHTSGCRWLRRLRSIWLQKGANGRLLSPLGCSACKSCELERWPVIRLCRCMSSGPRR